MRNTHLPSITKQKDPKEVIDHLLGLILRAEWQGRKNAAVNVFLMQAAEQKARDMVEKDYFNHTSPIGVTANENLLLTGYVLPDWYPIKGNNIESIGIGYESPESVVKGWLNSPSHRVHVAGEIDFYWDQLQVGAAMAINKHKRTIWVFLSAP